MPKEDTQFTKGVSGNPGGRPKKLEELAVKISEMDEKYRLRLDAIADGGGGVETKDSIAAIKLLWAYAHGNPTTVITGKDGAPVVGHGLDMSKLSDEQIVQLREILRAAR